MSKKNNPIIHQTKHDSGTIQLSDERAKVTAMAVALVVPEIPSVELSI